MQAATHPRPSVHQRESAGSSWALVGNGLPEKMTHNWLYLENRLPGHWGTYTV